MITTFLMIFVVVCVLLLVIVTLSTVYVVRQQSVAIIERFGKFQKVAIIVTSIIIFPVL